MTSKDRTERGEKKDGGENKLCKERKTMQRLLTLAPFLEPLPHLPCTPCPFPHVLPGGVFFCDPGTILPCYLFWSNVSGNPFFFDPLLVKVSLLCLDPASSGMGMNWSFGTDLVIWCENWKDVISPSYDHFKIFQGEMMMNDGISELASISTIKSTITVSPPHSLYG